MASISYDSSTCIVTSISDGNGITHTYSDPSGTVGSNSTKVTIGSYSYTATWNSNMSGTAQTDGAGSPLYTVTAFDTNDPYRPAAITYGATSAVTSGSVTQSATQTAAVSGS